MMDLSKYPLEKLFHFVAGIIPGLIALLIGDLAAPGRFDWFFSLGFLGYRTKLSLILLTAFVVGNSLTTFLTAFLGAVGGAIGAVVGMRPYKPPASYDVAPWRDPRWRTLMKKRLGAGTPNDTVPMSQEIYDLRLKMIEFQPVEQRKLAVVALQGERINTYADDQKWARWYDHFHQLILQQSDREFESYVHKGLTFNLQAAALYVLISALVVPRVRCWWCLVLSSVWVVMLVFEIYWGLKRFTDKWLTLSDQLKYLSDGDHTPGITGNAS